MGEYPIYDRRAYGENRTSQLATSPDLHAEGQSRILMLRIFVARDRFWPEGSPSPTPARHSEAMNEFQAILTIVVYFAVRIGIPALVIYALARLVRRIQGPDPTETEIAPPDTRIAH